VITSFKKKEECPIRVKRADGYSVMVPVSESFDATPLLGFFVDFGVVSTLVVDGVGIGAWQLFDQHAPGGIDYPKPILLTGCQQATRSTGCCELDIFLMSLIACHP
jgi:hypothetical protein